jgi:hypothetical protein
MTPITLFWVQCVELLRKRLIIAGRDKKGLFFQVIFPAIQILLVLLILTITINPAGHTITLNASSFTTKGSITPVVYSAGAASSTVRDQVYSDTTFMKITNVNALNSTKLSYEMLQNSVKNRYGAYVFGDNILVNVTVDWNWVRTAIASVKLTDVSVEADNSNGVVEYNIFVGSVQNSNNVVIATNVSLNQDSFRFINITEILSLNAQLTLSNNSNLELTAHRVKFDFVTSVLCAYRLHVTTTTQTGTTVSRQFKRYCFTVNGLPSGMQVFASNQYSKYTVMHNSTAPHGMASFAGYSTKQYSLIY